MSDNSDNNNSDNNNSDNNNKNNNVKLYCKNCNVEIDHKIGCIRKCRLCNNEYSRNYYTKKTKVINNIKDKKGYHVEYANDKGKTIDIIITNENKRCRICQKTKIYTDFGLFNSNYKGTNKYYLSADCKDCLKVIHDNKKQMIKYMINCNLNEQIPINNIQIAF